MTNFNYNKMKETSKLKKRIRIGKDSAEVESRLSEKDEIKIRERLKYYRNVGYSDATIIERYENYMRRYLHSAKSYGFSCINHKSFDYTRECLVMAEVFGRLAEERGIYI